MRRHPRLPPRAVVVHSPFSGRSAQLSLALDLLHDTGTEIIDVIPIGDLDHQPMQGVIWQERGADIAIAAGGDGLIGGVITHIAESDLPLGILPLGTSNDVARSLNVPLILSDAVQAIVAGEVREADIGTALPAEQSPHMVNHGHLSAKMHGYFAHALTVGLNVEFARLATNVATRQRFGRLAYPVAALEVLTHHRPHDISLYFSGPGAAQWEPGFNQQPALQGRILQVAVINAPIFGGQWSLALPRGSINDRLLDIVVIEDMSLERINAAIAQFFHLTPQSKEQVTELNPPPKKYPAELSNIPGLHHFQASRILIKTEADPQDVTLDGEIRGQTPVHVSLAQKRLRVVVPQRGSVKPHTFPFAGA